ncbi:DUF4926 domain-containing protein [Chrysosporum ovalisporum FSS-62]|uniref:DUF4926 domain-containing protein n=1 Tax=Umezakia ovalisporum FSS-62 TaxID=2971776 RepID=A0AA43H022_9CYAN|nr:DUF4926 domain-containing protein [Umezakia ovalisporum FSS-62]
MFWAIFITSFLTFNTCGPKHNLLRGQVGTMVKLLADGAAFEVELSDSNGQTYESIGLRSQQITGLNFEPASPNLVAEMVTP